MCFDSRWPLKLTTKAIFFDSLRFKCLYSNIAKHVCFMQWLHTAWAMPEPPGARNERSARRGMVRGWAICWKVPDLRTLRLRPRVKALFGAWPIATRLCSLFYVNNFLGTKHRCSGVLTHSGPLDNSMNFLLHALSQWRKNLLLSQRLRFSRTHGSTTNISLLCQLPQKLHTQDLRATWGRRPRARTQVEVLPQGASAQAHLVIPAIWSRWKCWEML